MMKNLLPILLALLAAAVPVSAREGQPPKATSPAKPAPSERENLVSRVESCEAILREFTSEKAALIPANVLKQARAIIIVNQFKAGFIVGVQGGYGVILVKRANGWSTPALLRAGEASLGLQLGGKAVETVYVITDEQTPRLLLNGRFDIGADAKAVAGPRVAEADAWKDGNPLKVPVLIYSRKNGLYAGATVKAGFVTRDDDANRLLYNTTTVHFGLPEQLYGDYVKPVIESEYLRNYVQRITR